MDPNPQQPYRPPVYDFEKLYQQASAERDTHRRYTTVLFFAVIALCWYATNLHEQLTAAQYDMRRALRESERRAQSPSAALESYLILKALKDQDARQARPVNTDTNPFADLEHPTARETNPYEKFLKTR